MPWTLAPKQSQIRGGVLLEEEEVRRHAGSWVCWWRSITTDEELLERVCGRVADLRTADNSRMDLREEEEAKMDVRITGAGKVKQC